MLLKEIVEGKRYAFYKEAADWKDAIKKSCSPLVATNCATEEYAQRIAGTGDSAFHQRLPRCAENIDCICKV